MLPQVLTRNCHLYYQTPKSVVATICFPNLTFDPIVAFFWCKYCIINISVDKAMGWEDQCVPSTHDDTGLGNNVGWSVCLVGCSLVWLVRWLVGWSVGLVAWLVGRSVDRSIDRFGWLVGRFSRLVGWLVGWLNFGLLPHLLLFGHILWHANVTFTLLLLAESTGTACGGPVLSPRATRA